MADTSSVAIRLRFSDAPDSLALIISAIANAGGTLRTLSTPRVAGDVAEAELEVAGIEEHALGELLHRLEAVRERRSETALCHVEPRRRTVLDYRRTLHRNGAVNSVNQRQPSVESERG